MSDNFDDDVDINLQRMWAEAAKKQKDWRDAGETVLLQRMHDAYAGLKACGWREIIYCPKDGTVFLAICAGSTGAFPCSYKGTWPHGSWWIEDAGDLWPSYPILWKAMPQEQSK